MEYELKYQLDGTAFHTWEARYERAPLLDLPKGLLKPDPETGGLGCYFDTHIPQSHGIDMPVRVRFKLFFKWQHQTLEERLQDLRKVPGEG